jgi:hypothetical protein
MAKHFGIRRKAAQSRNIAVPPHDDTLRNVAVPPHDDTLKDAWNAKIDEIFNAQKEEDFLRPAVEPDSFLQKEEASSNSINKRDSLSGSNEKVESKGLELLAWLGAGFLSLIIFVIARTSSFYFVTAPLFLILLAILLSLKARREEDRKDARLGIRRTEPRANPVTEGVKGGLITVGFLFACLAAITIGAILLVVMMSILAK